MAKISQFFEWLLQYENRARDKAEMIAITLCIFYFIGQVIRTAL
jgi:hypothetical protein